MTRRILRGLAAAGLLVALSAGAVSAGGWATIQADTGNPQPNAGEPLTFGFMVLQHGVTPAGWVETPTFVAINGKTGERIEAKAVAQGADGHFVATVTLPSAGYWTWEVQLTDLIVETAPQPMAVALPDGTLPAMDTGSMLAAMERIRSEIRTEYQTQLFNETDSLQTRIAILDSKVTYLEKQREALAKQVKTLSEAPPVTPRAPESVPLFAVIGIAVLAGAISGFAMTMLGRSSRPTSGAPDGTAEEPAPATSVLTTR